MSAPRRRWRRRRTGERPLIVVPDGARQLSDGLCVEASVVARLFRMRLLVIDARVVVAPAEVKREEPPAARAAPPPLTPVTGSRRPIGERLAAAERTLSASDSHRRRE